MSAGSSQVESPQADYGRQPDQHGGGGVGATRGGGLCGGEIL